MQTKILKIDPKNPDIRKIRSAAQAIQSGNLVAFPTETVYGLGADALNEQAVKKIFKAKGRPQDNPLIVHIQDKNDICHLAKDIPKIAEELMSRYWPGPLTLVLKKSPRVPDATTCGMPTIAIRMPANTIALALIKESGAPIAAPSANISGKPSPTEAQHVIDDLSGKIDIIIDGGKTTIGLESTVLDLTTDTPVLLRPGKITYEDLKDTLPRLNLHPSLTKQNENTIPTTVKSPGMKYAHYAPDARVILIEGKKNNVKNKIQDQIETYKRQGKKIAVMTVDKNSIYDAHNIKFIGSDYKTIAKNIFKTFREFDKDEIDIILIEGIKDKGLGMAIMNRLRKAAYEIIIV